jgi:hypothetical protein
MVLRNGASASRPASVAFVSGPDLARAAEIEFVSCCHCGRQHPVRQSIELLAKGREVLGYCARCNGVHCPSCAECVPAERQLENIEAGRSPLDVSRVTVAIPRAIEG